MSDNMCPKCNYKVDRDNKFCPNCGFSLDNKRNDVDDIKNNFINFKDDIASKIQNKLENEDIFNSNDIKEMIKNLDEDSLNKLLDKHSISPSRFKLLNFNKLFDKVDIGRLKDDLMELGIINPKPDSDVKTVKAKVIIDEDDIEEEPHETEDQLIDDENVDEEPVVVETEEKIDNSPENEESLNNEDNDVTEEKDFKEKKSQMSKESESLVDENDKIDVEHSCNSNICSECGFENRSNVKFCTKCGNKLI